MRPSARWSLAVLLGALALVSCRDGTGPKGGTGSVASVVVRPDTVLTSVGATVALRPQALDAGGNVVSGQSFTCQSLNSAVITVGTCIVSAVGSGQGVVSATTGSVTGYALLTVTVAGATGVNSWAAMTSGTSVLLREVWCADGSTCFAAGDGGTILRYNGTSWSAMTSNTTADLKSIWGTSASDVYAVGNGGTIVHYNGTSWSAMTSGVTTPQLLKVWGHSPKRVFVGGQSGTLLRYDGTSWSALTSGTTQDLWALWGASRDTVYAGGTGGTILGTTNGGTTWSALTSGTTQTVFDFWGQGTCDVYAVGGGGTILHYNCSAWSAMTSCPRVR